MQLKIPFGEKEFSDQFHDDDVEVTLKDGWTKRRIAYVVCMLALAILFITRFEDVLSLVGKVYEVLLPFFIGAVFAYLLNLIMSQLEEHYFPNSSKALVVKTRRLVCLLLSLLIVAFVLTVVIVMVSGQMAESMAALFQGITAAFHAVSDFVQEFSLDTGYLAVFSNDLSEWETIITDTIAQIGGVDKVVSSAFSLTGALTSGIFDLLIALVFAVYLLMGKERVRAGAKTLGYTVLSEKNYNRVYHACCVADDCFSKFISGQCFEAMILGTLCSIGMSLLGIPYALTIGPLVGLFSLVPMVGAWAGGIVGALMILPASLEQALIFVVFLLILQQIEGNFIYPRVVGSSVGVSAIWVLFAVFAGGALFGVAGVLLGVPFVATVGRLLDEVWKREPESGGSGDSPGGDEPGASDGPSGGLAPGLA